MTFRRWLFKFLFPGVYKQLGTYAYGYIEAWESDCTEREAIWYESQRQFAVAILSQLDAKDKRKEMPLAPVQVRGIQRG